MRMFYHMFGRHAKDLIVYIQRDGSQAYTTLFTATGNNGDKWSGAVVDLSKEYTPFRIIIEGLFLSFCIIYFLFRLFQEKCYILHPGKPLVPPTSGEFS